MKNWGDSKQSTKEQELSLLETSEKMHFSLDLNDFSDSAIGRQTATSLVQIAGWSVTEKKNAD